MGWKPDICIHHFPCDDGFAAAWVVKRKWPDVVLVGTNYGMMFPDLDYRGKNILIADFSYKPDALSELMMSFGARSIVMLDHHKTAEADLKEFRVDMCGSAKFVAADIGGLLRDLAELDRPAIAARFDMERSGASLAWEFCFPDEPMPVFIQFIEDRDLWRFKLKETRAFSLYLRSFPMTFEAWDRVAAMVESDANLVMGEALSIERFYDAKLAEMAQTATLKSIGKWKDVPVAHAPYAFASDLAHELLKAHPAAPFAAVVVDAYGGRTYSLRSEDSREDVSAVAKTFGGGGHRNAAGFRVPA
jgi:oligoribonuclease NrnB/cAMP/cGMP phosphodiesterase (DHH superfamily)